MFNTSVIFKTLLALSFPSQDNNSTNINLRSNETSHFNSRENSTTSVIKQLAKENNLLNNTLNSNLDLPWYFNLENIMDIITPGSGKLIFNNFIFNIIKMKNVAKFDYE